jgi:5'-nucleotidase
MPYSVDDKLVVAVASSALFDLTKSNQVYECQGTAAYRLYQRQHEGETLGPGVAFPFVKRLLSLNQLDSVPAVEVVLLSRNDSDTGLRVMNSIAGHELPISRAAFLGGDDPYKYIRPFRACLFLSASQRDVEEAGMQGLPAGRVLACDYIDDVDDPELRIAFDFDGVLISDDAERVFQTDGIDVFHASEAARALEAHTPGPLKMLLEELGKLHQIELEKAEKDDSYQARIKIAIITARDAPAHERVVTTLREWGVHIDQTFFLGGMAKASILEVFKPHIYFDDQQQHLDPTSGIVPSVHVPVTAIGSSAGTEGKSEVPS